MLVTGVTSSGKTTTLASIIQEINETRGEHIITLEDPVEYKFENLKRMISQREVGKNVVSFAQGLRASLRSDTDIIYVWEIRDVETADIALFAAETGNLVFSTLHTKSAAESVERYVNFFEPQQQNSIRQYLTQNLYYVLNIFGFTELGMDNDIPFLKKNKSLILINPTNTANEPTIILREGKKSQ